MNDGELLRYARHLMLPEIDLAGQQRLLRAHALIVGAGGLGSPVALYLGSAGVGTLTVADGDAVELGNLQRQIAHTQSRIGSPKPLSIQQAVAAINPDVRVEPVLQRLDACALLPLARAADVVIDCSDNFATRQAVNRACVATGTALVWGAVARFEGQAGLWQPPDAHSPCYACTFAPQTAPEPQPCATTGVFAPLVGIVGCIQAAEAIKLLCGIPQGLSRHMLLVDALRMQMQRIALQRQPQCPVCGRAPQHTA